MGSTYSPSMKCLYVFMRPPAMRWYWGRGGHGAATLLLLDTRSARGVAGPGAGRARYFVGGRHANFHGRAVTALGVGGGCRRARGAAWRPESRRVRGGPPSARRHADRSEERRVGEEGGGRRAWGT